MEQDYLPPLAPTVVRCRYLNSLVQSLSQRDSRGALLVYAFVITGILTSMIRWTCLVVIGLGACTFDQSAELSNTEDSGSTEADSRTFLVSDSAPIDAELLVPDAELPLPMCELFGTVGNPITFLGQINTLATGRYSFFIGGNNFEGEVRVDSDGNAWLMVLNYLHLANTNADLQIYDDRLPLLSNASLGTDESGTPFWGHSSNKLFAELAVDELRFYGRSSAHPRVIHFRTTHAPTIEHFATGQGAANGLGTDFEQYSDHTAGLPATQTHQFRDQGALAQTNFPFYEFGVIHWGIRGLGYRWEVDDYNGGVQQPSTMHRIMVRSHAICGNGVREGLEACDDGNQLAGDGCGCCVEEDN